MSLIRTISFTLLALLISIQNILLADAASNDATDGKQEEEITAREKLPPAVDLQNESRVAACNGQPLVIMFGSSTCPYCHVVRSLYLGPLEGEGRYPGIIVREVDTGSTATVKDFSGKMTTMEDLAAHYGITLVPVVMVFLPGGVQVGKTLLGLTTEDFYGAYLQQSIEAGIESVRNMPSAAPSAGPGAYVCD